MQGTELPDITGDGSTHTLLSQSGLSPLPTTLRCKWIQFIADKNNGAAIRIGGSLTTSSRGLPIAAGSAMFFPQISDFGSMYDLGTTFYNASNGDKLYVMYA